MEVTATTMMDWATATTATIDYPISQSDVFQSTLEQQPPSPESARIDTTAIFDTSSDRLQTDPITDNAVLTDMLMEEPHIIRPADSLHYFKQRPAGGFYSEDFHQVFQSMATCLNYIHSV